MSETSRVDYGTWHRLHLSNREVNFYKIRIGLGGLTEFVESKLTSTESIDARNNAI